eukprot:11604861-Karenia_brevis.AAC.1
MKYLISLPNIFLTGIHQCAFGAASRKDTNILSINYNFGCTIRQHCTHNGRCPGLGPTHTHVSRIGRDANGLWNTAPSKVHPAGLCE